MAEKTPWTHGSRRELNSRTEELRDIDRLTLAMPDGTKIFLNSETDDEVIVTVTRPDGQKAIESHSRAEFEKIIDE